MSIRIILERLLSRLMVAFVVACVLVGAGS